MGGTCSSQARLTIAEMNAQRICKEARIKQKEADERLALEMTLLKQNYAIGLDMLKASVDELNLKQISWRNYITMTLFLLVGQTW